ncbi:hypothetical protein EsH8_V_000976 [Colletotrichum jinshuiense]
MLESHGILLEPTQLNEEYLAFNATKEQEVDESKLGRRVRCATTASYAVDASKTQSFVDWDMQMSYVACSTTIEQTIAVSQGFSIANSVSISGGGDSGTLMKYLGLNFGVDYTRTWTTTTTMESRGTITKGNCGIMIWKPLTVRHYGRVLQGCPGSYQQVGSLVANDHGTGR